MQDFEGQRLVERIAHYAVIELAVRWSSVMPDMADILMQVFAFFLGFMFQSIQVTFTVLGLGVCVVFVVRVGFSSWLPLLKRY